MSSEVKNPREWWGYFYPEDPGGYCLREGEKGETAEYPTHRVRLIEWAEAAASRERELEATVERLRGALKKREWTNGHGAGGGWCPICERVRHQGHKKDCFVGNALGEQK